ncbi:hypothetical protein SpCBS45565_g06449 [Spizellomyces sp. 'palustris']|nr:hypothetical protein SpCBS45565_g06449 [Spizellomyces sp. 'palustris']
MTTPASPPPKSSSHADSAQRAISYRERMGSSPFVFFPDSSLPTHDEAFREDLLPTSAAVPLERLKEYLPGEVVPTMAFAKLEGPDFVYHIKKLQVSLGRRGSSADQVDIDLGTSNSISRLHAMIQFNRSIQKFELAVYGKNGVWVNGEHVHRGMDPVPLEHGTELRVSDIETYFIIPGLDPPNQAPHELREARLKRAAPPSTLPEPQTRLTHSIKKPRYELSSSRPTFSSYSRPEQHLIGDSTLIPTWPPSAKYRDMRPPYSYIALITQAIYQADEGKITLNGIYNWISKTYSWYKLDQTGWQNSVRHNLSLGRWFIKLKRNEPGKGGWWALDKDVPPHELDEMLTQRRFGRGQAIVVTPTSRGHAPMSPTDEVSPFPAESLPVSPFKSRQEPLQQLARAATGEMPTEVTDSASRPHSAAWTDSSRRRSERLKVPRPSFYEYEGEDVF